MECAAAREAWAAMMSVAELLERLDDAGERRGIEAKRGLGDAAEETICAFVNEPDLGGGYLLFGVEETADGSFQIVGVSDPQKLQQDLTSICAGLVNALMHRDYRENRPMQIIRYSDRIEVHNAGYSLTPDDRFGEPGSTLRNPCLSAVFRDVRLAEAKGTGIRAVRRAMKDAGMEPPVFQSDRGANLFIATLWLHNLLDEDELGWLREVGDRGLTDPQKHALVVARRTGKVANGTLRDLCALDTLAASRELRTLRDKGLLVMRGKAAGAFYVLSPAVLEREERGSQRMHGGQSSPRSSPQTQRRMGEAPCAPGQAAGGAMGQAPAAMGQAPAAVGQAPAAMGQALESLPEALRRELDELKKRPSSAQVHALILALCRIAPRTKQDLATLLGRTPKHVVNRFLTPMVRSGELEMQHPDPTHPAQAYRTTSPGGRKKA